MCPGLPTPWWGHIGASIPSRAESWSPLGETRLLEYTHVASKKWKINAAFNLRSQPVIPNFQPGKAFLLVNYEFLPSSWSDFKSIWLCTASEVNKVALICFKWCILQVFALDKSTYGQIYLVKSITLTIQIADWGGKHTSLIVVS